MMLNSLQVLDHQLIFHIMYGPGQFHHRQNKGEERRGEIWQKKKQQLLSKHRAAADGVCCTAIGVLVCIKTANMTWIWVVRGAAIYCNLRFFFYLCNCNTQPVKLAEKPQNLSKDHGYMQTLHWHMERVNKIHISKHEFTKYHGGIKKDGYLVSFSYIVNWYEINLTN